MSRVLALTALWLGSVGCVDWKGVEQDFCANHRSLPECGAVNTDAGNVTQTQDAGDSPKVLFAISAGGPNTDVLNAMVTDRTGRTAVGGAYLGGMVFGPTSFASYGNVDGFVGVIEADGGAVSAQSVGGSETDAVLALDFLDDRTNLAVGGKFQTQLASATPPVSASGVAGFSAVMDGAGKSSQVKTFGSNTTSLGNVDVVGVGNLSGRGLVVVAGHGQAGPNALCDGASRNFAGGFAFFAGYDTATQACPWVTTLAPTASSPSDSAAMVGALAVGPGSNDTYALVLVRGEVSATSGGDVVTLNGGTGRWYIVSVNSSGVLKYFDGYETPNPTATTRVRLAFGSTGELWVLSERSGSLIAAGTTQPQALQQTDVVVGLVRNNGGVPFLAKEWILSSPGEDLAGGISIDSSGRAWVTGRSEGLFTAGGRVATGRGQGDIFVVGLTEDATVGPFIFGTLAEERGLEISAAAGLTVGGTFTQQLRLGGTTLSSAGAEDIFVFRMQP